jgi:protein-tyrosine phosphatase
MDRGELWSLRSELQEVAPGVFITNGFGARKSELLKKQGVTAVLNLTNELQFPAGDFVCRRIGFADNATGVTLPLTECFAFIEETLRGGGRVVVHCAAGSSRSGSIVVAWVMRSRSLSFAEALRHVQSIRPVVLPNPGALTLEARRAPFNIFVDCRKGSPSNSRSWRRTFRG